MSLDRHPDPPGTMTQAGNLRRMVAPAGRPVRRDVSPEARPRDRRFAVSLPGVAVLRQRLTAAPDVVPLSFDWAARRCWWPRRRTARPAGTWLRPFRVAPGDTRDVSVIAGGFEVFEIDVLRRQPGRPVRRPHR
jgi:hypothetical protein